jgi:hypothetical protein
MDTATTLVRHVAGSTHHAEFAASGGPWRGERLSVLSDAPRKSANESRCLYARDPWIDTVGPESAERHTYEGSRATESMEAKLKHLEFIQAVIARMATNSFLFKGWSITVAAGLSAFAAVNNKWALGAIAVAATFIFWALDGYYLWLEHEFIKIYDKVAAADESNIDFHMSPSKEHPFCNWLRTCWRPHLCVLYGMVIVADVVELLILRSS